VPICAGFELNLLQILFALGFASAALAAGANGPIVHHTQLDWDNDAPWFGGLSGAEMRADGKQMTVISDRGRIMVADLTRDALGTLTGLEVIHSVALRDENGAVMDKPHADAEGLAIAPDGSIFISYEGQHRIARTNLADGTTEEIIAPPQSASLRENAGFEALAVDAEGSLYALPEDTRSNQIPLYKYQNDAWSIAAYLEKDSPFVPVGADFDDEGRLYLLERTVTPLGFRTRLRRIELADDQTSAVTLLQTLPARYDNLEALTVWRDGVGRTRVTMISDDNFLSVQQTQVIELTITQ